MSSKKVTLKVPEEAEELEELIPVIEDEQAEEEVEDEIREKGEEREEELRKSMGGLEPVKKKSIVAKVKSKTKTISLKGMMKQSAKKEVILQTYKDFIQQEPDTARGTTTHFPYYQDHYHYPGYIIFTQRKFSEAELRPGWTEEMENEQRRKDLIMERIKIRKRVKRPEVKLLPNARAITDRQVKFDDPEILGDTVIRKLGCLNPRYSLLYQWNHHLMEYREMTKPSVDHEYLARIEQGLVHVDSQEAQWQKEDEEQVPSVESLLLIEPEMEEKPPIVEEKKEELEEDLKERILEEEAQEEEEEPSVVEEEEIVLEESMEEEGKEGVEEEEGAEKEGEKEDSEAPGGQAQLEIMEKLKLLEDEPPIRYRRSKKLFNLFNFTDRGIQGELIMTAEKSSETTPIPMGSLNGFVCKYVVLDAYQRDVVAREAERKEKERNEVDFEEEEEPAKDQSKAPQVEAEESSEDEFEQYRSFNEETAHSARILERMVVQNSLFENTADMKFYEDPADEILKGEGRLLPLWTFKRKEFKDFTVTSLSFSPSNPDMFGVSHGCSVDFSHTCVKGFVSVYSIKDPMNPEYKKECAEPITSFDYHPTRPGYIAYATYNGHVHCCDTRDPPDNEDSAMHSFVEEAHQSVVWQVLWDPNPEERNFYTISADGIFCKWNVRNASIVKSIAMCLNYPSILASPYLACPFSVINEFIDPEPIEAVATTMTFHPTKYEYVMIGTSDGLIMKCSLLFTSKYLFVYYSHTLNVTRIHFNLFVPTLFISAAEDRRVNIQEEGREKPLYSFVQNCGVMDVQWAPYSSTVFALITKDCRIAVFDININKYKPICNQFVLWKYGETQLTTLRFSPTRPLLMVGDSSGTIMSLKLSPNLRTKAKRGRRQKDFDPQKLEVNKLELCLFNIREPEAYAEPDDIKSIRSQKELIKESSESEDDDYFRIGEMVYKMTTSSKADHDIYRRVKRRIQESAKKKK